MLLLSCQTPVPPAGVQGMTSEQDPSLLSLCMTVTPGARSISMTSVIPARSDSGMDACGTRAAGWASVSTRVSNAHRRRYCGPARAHPEGIPTDPGHSHGQIPGSSSGRSGADRRSEPRVNPAQTSRRSPGRSHPRADGSERRGAPPDRQQRGQPRRGG